MIDQEAHMGVMICWASFKRDAPGEDVPVEEVAKKAFQMTRDSSYVWYTTEDDTRFHIGCGVLLRHYKNTETYYKIEATLRALRSISALMTGVPVDLEQIAEEDTLPLLAWYKETAPSEG